MVGFQSWESEAAEMELQPARRSSWSPHGAGAFFHAALGRVHELPGAGVFQACLHRGLFTVSDQLGI